MTVWNATVHWLSSKRSNVPYSTPRDCYLLGVNSVLAQMNRHSMCDLVNISPVAFTSDDIFHPGSTPGPTPIIQTCSVTMGTGTHARRRQYVSGIDQKSQKKKAKSKYWKYRVEGRTATSTRVGHMMLADTKYQLKLECPFTETHKVKEIEET